MNAKAWPDPLSTMNTPACLHRLDAILLLASAVAGFFSACTEVPTTAENSAPIGFCRATVPPSLSRDLERLAVSPPRQTSGFANVSWVGGQASDRNDMELVPDASGGSEPPWLRYEPAEGMPKNVEIERLTPADREQLEAKYRDRPLPQLITIPPAPSGLLTALNIAGQATVYLVVGTDGNVKDIYLADCTDEHVAQAVALRLAATTFDPPAQECLFQIKYYAQPFNIQLSQGKNITMVRENILPERSPVAAQPAALTTIPASSIAVPPPPTASEIRRSEREHWKSAELPGIKVFSTASNRDSQRILHDLLLFCRALGTLRSADSVNASTPVTLVLCAHYGEYAQFNLNGNPRSRSMSRPTAAEPTVVINLDIPMMDDAVAADAIAAALQRFYVQVFLMRMGGHLPPWLNQGLGKTLRGMVCTDDAIHFPGLATDPTLKERRAGSADDLQAALKDGMFLNFDQLFADVNHPRSHSASVLIPPGGARYAWLNLEPSGTWEDECYEFVHLCLFGAGGKYRQAFFQFAREAMANPPDETMFRNAFGVDYQTMLLELWRYTAVGSGMKIKLLNPDGSPLPPVPEAIFQAADPGEISRLKDQMKLPAFPR